LEEIDLDVDCLRFYRLPDSRGAEVREHGKFRAVDFDSSLVV
jgi:CRISPR-associated protein Cas2